MKRAHKITKNAGHPVCPYCNHPNDVFHFNLHKEGEPINASCDSCGAEYQWIRYVVELYISDTMPEPAQCMVLDNVMSIDADGHIAAMLPEEEIR
jgi:hypothetical protein